MTIGDGESSRYIVINPGTRKFESLNPGALFVALSRTKYIGVCLLLKFNHYTNWMAIFWKFTYWIYYVHDSSRRAIKEAKFYI
jgi:hypothetical protein